MILLFWIGLALLFASLVIAVFVESWTREVEDDFEAPVGEGLSTFDELRARFVKVADRRLRQQGRGQELRHKLEVSGSKMRVTEWLVAVAGVAVLVAPVLFFLRGPVFGIIGLIGTPVVAYFGLNMKVSKRQKKFADDLPETLQLLAGSLRAGMSFVQAFSAVGQEAPDPTREEIRKVLTENRLGRDIIDSLRDLAVRMGSQDFGWVVSAVEVNREVGGNLAEVLERVGQTIRARNRVAGQVKALSAEGRLSGYILTGLPPSLGILMFTINPRYMEPLHSTTNGNMLLGAAGLMLVVGALVMRKLARFAY